MNPADLTMPRATPADPPLPDPPVAAVIGWPIGQSKSPRIHRFWLEALGLDGDYARLPVRPERLARFIEGLPATGLRGVNVTVPHKIAILPLLDGLDDGAARIGAVNTVTVAADGTTRGQNTDIVGLEETVAGLPVAEVVVLGAGGAARAAVAMLAARPGTRVHVVARRPEQARALLDAFGCDGGTAVPARFDLLVNATTVGMNDGCLAADADTLARCAAVADLVYAPLETPLLAAARARGLVVRDGLHMLIGQAAAAFRLFYGTDPPRSRDPELRALLTR